MTAFWLAALGMTAAVLACLLVPLLRAGPHARLAALLMALLPAAAAGLYLYLGTPAAVAVQSGQRLNGESSPELMVSRLAARLRRQPGDGDAWAMLARSYEVLGRPDDAAGAYRHALALTPRDAALLADYADVLATVNGGDLNAASLPSIETALAQEPANPKALALAGSAALQRRDYAGAAQFWRRLAASSAAGPDVAAQARRNLDEALQLEKQDTRAGRDAVQ